MAFRIHGEVSLDGAMFKRGLHEVGESATDFIKEFALGAIGIYSVQQAFEKTIDSAGELVNTSKKLDVSIEQLQVLRHAAEENGVEFGKMSTALEKFNAVRENVLNGGKGSKDQLAALGRLGINRETLQNQTAAQSIMGQISDTAQHSNAADIANDLKVVLGRGGEELFGVLKTDFAETERELKSFGAIMDSTTAVELKQFKDGTGLISQVLEAEFAPAIVMLWKVIFETISALGTFGTMLGTWAGNIAGILTHPLDAFKHPVDTFKNIFALGAFGEGGQEAKNYWDKQQDILTAFDANAKKTAYDLDHPKPPSTSSEPLHVKVKKDPHERLEHGDSLIASGNFLGSGPSSINSIAKEQLEISKLQLSATRDIVTALNTQRNDEDIDFEN